MNNSNQPISEAVVSVESPSAIKEFLTLVKARLTSLVVFTAVMGYVITAGGAFSWYTLMFLVIGGFGITGAANALNQVLEKDYDKLMQRTANRPLAADRMRPSEAVFMAGMLCLLGVTALAVINPIASMLGMTSMVLYAFLYTPMKRYTTLSVWIGGIPGALPIMIGCVAGEGTITWLAAALFGIQYLWQLPHFWSIGFLSYEDYSAAGYKVVPSDPDGNIDPSLGWWSVAMTVLMLIIFGAMYGTDLISGWAALLGLLATGVYMFYSWRFSQNMERGTARQLMFSSFLYLPIVLLVLTVV